MKKALSLLFLSSCLAGCFNIPLSSSYAGPPSLPPALETYYAKPVGKTYGTWTTEVIREAPRFIMSRIKVETPVGQITIDHYARREQSEDLIFVFPLLGGKKNMIESYFAETYAVNGFDTAIIHRDESFKDPANIDRLEDIMQRNVIRDRIAIDFFENEYGKRKFGSFGISRGAINVAMTAGVEPRLQYNVLALGGTKLVRIFAKSKERRIQEFRRKVRENKVLDGDQFNAYLESTLKTDPKNLSQYMDARNTLLFLALLDNTVPIRYGRQLRRQIGRPRTIFLFADHRTSILYTQFIPLLPPSRFFGVFPFDYIETESLAFYNDKFERPYFNVKHILFQTLQFPFETMEWIIRKTF